MSIVNYIKALKLLFLRSIIVMGDHLPIRRIFASRLNEFSILDENPYDSPIIHALQICKEFNVMENVRGMVACNIPSKARWRHIIWAWSIEDEEWQRHFNTNTHLDLMSRVMDLPAYSIWWQISDGDRTFMRQCEVMVKLICHSSKLKDDDYRFKKPTIAERMCILCDHAASDDARHMVMQCPHHATLRGKKQNEVCYICPDVGTREVFNTILGKPLESVEVEDMHQIWKITSRYTARMYWETIGKRIEVKNNLFH